MTPHLRTISAVGALLVAGVSDTLHAQVVRWRDAAGREVERRCQPAKTPKHLPELDSVLDAAALSAVHGVPSQSDTATLLISILYREDGTRTVRLLEPDSLPLAESALLLDPVARGLRPVSPARPLAAIRLRLQRGLEGSAAIERSVYCPPEPARVGPTGPRRVSVEIGPGDRLPTPGRRMRIDAELSIDETGQVADVRLMTRTGIRELDDQFVRIQSERVFSPALIDGLPIASWVRTSGQRMRM